jgi:hypothetical protein
VSVARSPGINIDPLLWQRYNLAITTNPGHQMNRQFIEAPRELLVQTFCMSIDYFEECLERFSLHLIEDTRYHEAAQLLQTLHELTAITGNELGVSKGLDTFTIPTIDLCDILHHVTLVKSYSLIVGIMNLHMESWKLEREINKVIKGDHDAKN